MSQFEKIGCIYFKTVSALALWDHEILGQLSDGMWENTLPLDHWEFWHRLKSAVGSENRVEMGEGSRVPYRQKTGYGIGSLVPIVGDRMRVWGRWAKAQGYVGKKCWDLEKLERVKDFEAFNMHSPPLRGLFDIMEVQKYFSTTYTEKEFRADIRHIKEAMKSIARK